MLDYIDTEWGKAWVSSQFHGRRGVFLPLIYIDINDGNLTDALVFAQIMYWHEPSRETGKSRLRIFLEGHWWLVKNHGDWWRETRVDKRVVRECLKRICDRGLIVYELHGRAGKKAPHIRVEWAEFERRVKLTMGPEGLLVPPDDSGRGGCADGDTPDESGTGGVRNPAGGGTKSVKSNTEITTETTTAETTTEQVPGWVLGLEPIPRVWLLPPPPRVDASDAIAFFGANIDAVNPYLESVIDGACQQYGLAAVMAALRYAAGRNAKRWEYVVKRLEGQAEDQAAQVARAERYQVLVAESSAAAVPLADAQRCVPTKQEPSAIEALCPGGQTAQKTWQMVFWQLEAQMDRGTVERYLHGLRLIDYAVTDHRFVVGCPSDLVRRIWALDHRFNRHLTRILEVVYGQPVVVEFVVEEKRGAA